MQRDEHIKVDILVSRFSEKTQNIIEIVNYTCALVFVITLTVSSFEMTVTAFERGKTDISAILVPMYIPYAFVPIGSALLTIVIMGRIVRNICLLKGWLTISSDQPQE
jgi:TRAP-type C4-dicarboxylate transport system permease small subunit